MDSREDRVKPEDVEREIEEIRGRMEPVLEELSRRGRRVAEWKHEVRHLASRAWKPASVAGGLIAAVRFLKRRRERRGAHA